VLEWAGVLSWQHRIIRTRERCTDLFGREGWEWRVHRRSNAYAFCDPQQHTERPSTYKSENPSGTQDQDILDPVEAPMRALCSPLERALHRLSGALSTKNGIEQEGGR
jgi:hypothetical protein